MDVTSGHLWERIKFPYLERHAGERAHLLCRQAAGQVRPPGVPDGPVPLHCRRRAPVLLRLRRQNLGKDDCGLPLLSCGADVQSWLLVHGWSAAPIPTSQAPLV